ncbi:hypothetical protein [Faecalibaculum rodentium]|uniref:hypothetical protein n=1 Tax=Faecalibaculum rodentium TaxID=1702221 RepID=UPI0025B77FBB|nr:hypothetical protein [Faecalibaculum rodentium]
MASYNDFKAKYIGKATDVDGYYGAQCWDLYAAYARYLGYPICHCTVTGYVQDIWTQRKTNGILNHFTEVTVMQPGDVAVFRKSPSTPLSHIAIFDHDAGGGYGWFFGQNQGGQNGAANLVKLPYSATYDTAFRPKCFGTTTQKPAASAKKWTQNCTLRVGDRTKSVSCAIQGIQGNCVRCDALGGLVPLAHVSEARDTRDGACDNYLATTNARITLDECTVEDVDVRRNLVKVHGYWVKPGPLMGLR